MSRPTLHPTPSWRDVLAAEVGTVGIAIRPLAIVALVVAAVVTLVVTIDLARQGQGLTVFLEMAVLTSLVVALLPVAVWKEEYRVRNSYLASMPFGRSRHVVAKVVAGWIWLMAAVAAFLIWMFSWAAATGGEIGLFAAVPASELPPGATAEEAAELVRTVRTAPWQWLSFFTGATITYLIGSAVVLSGRPIRRWLAGIVVICFSVMFIDDEIIHLGGLAERIESGLILAIEGEYGLEVLLEARKETMMRTAADEPVILWHGPRPVQWLLTTLFWLALASAALLAVLKRDRRG